MSKLKALLLTIRNETTPIASHTDPLALNDVWREVFEIIEAVEHHAHLTPETQPPSQAVVNASALEQSDGDTPPAQAQVA